MTFFNILEKLAERGHDVSFVAMRSKAFRRLDNHKVRLVAIPLRFLPLLSSLMFDMVLFLSLPILIITSKSNVVVMSPDHTILGSFQALLFSKTKKTRFVLDVRSIPVESAGFQGFLQKLWFNFSVHVAKRFFSGFTVITPLMKSDFCNDFQIDPKKVGIWTSGVSDDLFNPDNPTLDKINLKKKYGLSEKFVVLYHGVFTATRGLPQTIESMKILSGTYPDIVFFLLGSGPIISSLKQLVENKGLEKNVIIRNPVEHVEVPKFIAMCDIGIVPLPNHPYWRSQSPLKLLEYLAMEKVVVLTDIPAHRAVVNEAKCGIYLSSIKATEIAKAIEYAYLNKSHLDEWGKAGRKIVKQDYTWEKVAGDLEGYLKNLDDVY